jgi:hypothetical protein
MNQNTNYNSRLSDEEDQRTKSEIKSEADTHSDNDQQPLTGKDDPFGDESESDVKYRTMTWWYVIQ